MGERKRGQTPLRDYCVNQLFRRIFRNSDFFQTHVRLSTLTFEKNHNHKNFLEKLYLRNSLFKEKGVRPLFKILIKYNGFQFKYFSICILAANNGAIFFIAENARGNQI